MWKFHLNLLAAGIILTICGVLIDVAGKKGGFVIPLNITAKQGRILYTVSFVALSGLVLWLFFGVFDPIRSDTAITVKNNGIHIPIGTWIALIVLCGFPFVNYFYGSAMAFQGLPIGIKTAAWVTVTIFLGFVADYLVRGGANLNVTQVLSALGGGVCLYFYFIGGKGGA